MSESISETIERLEEIRNERQQIANQLEGSAIALIEGAVSVIRCRPKGYEFSEKLAETLSALQAAIEIGTNQRRTLEGNKRQRRVSKAQKDELFKKIISEFQAENPEEKSISFAELKNRLLKLNFQTASVSIFFKSQLEGRQTSGQTRNMVLVLNDD